MENTEMIEILEGLIRDPDTNPTAKRTAIRTLMQIRDEAGADPLDEELDPHAGEPSPWKLSG